MKLRWILTDGASQTLTLPSHRELDQGTLLQFTGKPFATWKPKNSLRTSSATECARLLTQTRESARAPERGTSGSVQRGPANPARPGREQRYRVCLGCRSSPEVPLTEEDSQSSVIRFSERDQRSGDWVFIEPNVGL